MAKESSVEQLAEALQVPIYELEVAIGPDWSGSSTARDNLLIRGAAPERFNSDGVKEGDSPNLKYPDVGIHLDELNHEINVGTLIGRYGPGWLGFDVVPRFKINTWNPEALEKLGDAIRECGKLALSELRICKFCNEKLPPAFMSEEGHCYDCGTSHLGIVY